MNSTRVFVEGIGLYGPGMSGWQQCKEILAGHAPLVLAPTVLPPAEALPPAERRRVGVPIKLSMAIGFEAVRHAQADAAKLATVFSSTGGDCDNCHAILETLASDDRAVSPTRFHNSVHNAPSGYWSIATHCMAPSTSLCAYNATFAAGLIETATQAIASGEPCLLLAYDTAYPEPLYHCRPIPYAFGVAMLLHPERSSRALASLELNLANAPLSPMAQATLEELRTMAPAARSLPLLQLLACQASGQVTLEYLDQLTLQIEVTA